MHRPCARLLLMLLLLTATLLPACDNLEPRVRGASKDLEGTTWRLVVFQDPAGSKRAFRDGEVYTLFFDAGARFGGRADCNSYGGTYEAGDGTLRIRELWTTQVLCPPGSHGEDYYAALRNVQACEVRGGRLRLGFGGFGVLVFEPQPVRFEGED
ncbi:MAG: hypothetical protein KatS3mg043_0977 [Rhodothermaceae bacterium]|nr:MAG: hypothetical protein KatS3mg043_0977 [Rhodothermaceae bacterium]